MPDFGDHVGITFLEIMTGYVRGSDEPILRPDGVGLFHQSLRLVIPNLNRYLAGPHEAQITEGTVDWNPFVKNASVRGGGRVLMFRKDRENRKRRYFDFDYSFPSEQGFDIGFEGHKFLEDDRGFDAGADMSTVFCTLFVQGRPIARGVLNVAVTDFVRQLDSLHVTGARSKDEERAAREAFFGFMNGQLREIYPYVPLILREDRRLSQEEWKTLRFCAQLILPDPLPANGPTVDDVVENLQRYVAHAPEEQVRDIRNALQAAGVAIPILGVRPRDVRPFVAKELRRASPSPVRDVLELIHTLVTFPYYAHPKADALVGYRRPQHTPPDEPPLPVLAEPPARRFDVVIAGSGPAGSLLADRLTAQGKSVLLLEAGPYHAEREIDADELLWTARLYKRSALQRANEPESIFAMRGPSFMVLQGGCVGGGGVVNNTVCFRMSPRRLAHWRDAGFPLEAAALDAGYDMVARDLSIGPVSERARRLNPASRFLDHRFGAPAPAPLDTFPGPGFWECLVNLEPLSDAGAGCLGVGLCNVGCGSGRKRHGLRVHLRNAAARDCTIVAGARAAELRLNAAGTQVESLAVRLNDGRVVDVRGAQYVLSCGPIGSSEVLLRSPALQPRIARGELPVGRRFSANVGSPLFAFTDEPVNAEPGLQIAHAFVPFTPDEGFVVETWYNPPGANALAMPGWLDDHHTRMRAFATTIAAAPLVGSQPTGQVRLRDGAVDIRLPIGTFEMDRLARGLSLLATAFVEGRVREVVAGVGSGFVVKTAEDANRLHDEIVRLARNPRRQHLLRVGTGHPQGGNAMSSDAAIAVVDASFRVRGIDNLRVCDGSVFPDSSNVNPQWTIMALADRCAEDMRTD